jgi:flagellar motor switch protein FliM
MDALNAVLAHKLGLTPPEPDTSVDVVAPTPMRQMRPALSRAADKAVRLSASVLGVAEETLEAEALIETGPEDWVVIGLRDGANAGLTGFFWSTLHCDLPWLKCKRWVICSPPRKRNAK